MSETAEKGPGNELGSQQPRQGANNALSTATDKQARARLIARAQQRSITVTWFPFAPERPLIEGGGGGATFSLPLRWKHSI